VILHSQAPLYLKKHAMRNIVETKMKFNTPKYLITTLFLITTFLQIQVSSYSYLQGDWNYPACWKTIDSVIELQNECPLNLTMAWSPYSVSSFHVTWSVDSPPVLAWNVSFPTSWTPIHSNLHGCQTVIGTCTPLVQTTPGLVTSTESITSFTSLLVNHPYFYSTSDTIYLDPGEWTILAHAQFITNVTATTNEIQTWDVAIAFLVTISPSISYWKDGMGLSVAKQVMWIMALLLQVLLVGVLFVGRNRKVLIYSSWEFTFGFALSSLVLIGMAGSILYSISNNSCVATLWIIELSTTFMLATLVVKTLRIILIFHQQSMRTITISNKLLWLGVGLVMMIDIIFLASLYRFSSSLLKTQWLIDDQYTTWVCDLSISVWFVLTWKIVWFVVYIVLCLVCQSTPAVYHEGKYSLYGCLWILFTGTLAWMAYFHPPNWIGYTFISIWPVAWITTCIVIWNFILIGPKCILMYYYSDKRMQNLDTIGGCGGEGARHRSNLNRTTKSDIALYPMRDRIPISKPSLVLTRHRESNNIYPNSFYLQRWCSPQGTLHSTIHTRIADIRTQIKRVLDSHNLGISPSEDDLQQLQTLLHSCMTHVNPPHIQNTVSRVVQVVV
jgi:hypothetical protein